MPVVGTGGHVDHGKSTLVQALTGRDPDRWREEKERGLTIDLGFAWTTLDGQEVSFVDVPGHERFIKNMLAGTGGFDVALLVVAADEGWMPQSEEHLAVLDLLRIRHGLVAITKIDRADADLIELATLETEERLAGTALEDCPIVPVSAVTGEGLADLRAVLARVLAGAPVDVSGRSRLWVDRVFPVSGAGTVVTGTLVGGPLSVGGSRCFPEPSKEGCALSRLTKRNGEPSRPGPGRLPGSPGWTGARWREDRCSEDRASGFRAAVSWRRSGWPVTSNVPSPRGAPTNCTWVAGPGRCAS